MTAFAWAAVGGSGTARRCCRVRMFAEDDQPHLRGVSVKNNFGKTTLDEPDRDSNPDLPVISSLVYHESDALNHAVTEAGSTKKSYIIERWLLWLWGKPNPPKRLIPVVRGLRPSSEKGKVTGVLLLTKALLHRTFTEPSTNEGEGRGERHSICLPTREDATISLPCHGEMATSSDVMVADIYRKAFRSP
uniref:Uncharacterized protein n=1 Tax=Timema bartmani TaxID=61472 RepID=A0A7R9EQQ2_9NEOP|nr:unnamed protein product [Timema bartmani]